MSSIFTVTLPDIGEGVVEGEVIEWLKNEGDTLTQDEPVVTVMTDKATVELPSPYPGTLLKQYHKVGELAYKDLPLYDITLTKTEKNIPKQKIATPPPSPPVPEKAPPTSKKEETTLLAIPKVRYIAKELDININNITGSGKEGRVTKDDLKNFIKDVPKTNIKKTTLPPLSYQGAIHSLPGDYTEQIFGIRNLIVEKMVESKYIVPHFTFGNKLDATRLIKLRESTKQKGASEGIKVSYMPFFIRALSLCLSEYPIFNASVDMKNKQIIYHKEQNIGIAMKTELGTVIPVIKNIQNKSLESIVREFHHLIVKARANKLTSNDMKYSTFTISNFGAIGGLWGTPVINYPEVAILGIGKMEETPIVKRKHLTSAPIIQLSWSCDHRIIDGDVIASMSQMFTNLLEHPSKLL